MPSLVTNFTVATNNIVVEKLNAKVKPRAIFINNVNGAANCEIIFNDIFTPSVTNAVPIPVAQIIRRLHLNVAAGTCVSTEEELKKMEFLGTVQVQRAIYAAGVLVPTVDVGCYVTLIYGFDDEEEMVAS